MIRSIARGRRKIDFARPWNRAYKFCGSPRVAKPVIHTKKEEADKSMGEEDIAFFDLSKLETHVHYPNVVKKIGEGYLEPIFKHELNHHKCCPHDLSTLLALVDHADRVVRNIEKAKTIENLFADMVGNTSAINKGDTSIPKLYKKMSKGREKEKFWNMYMRSYEKLWGIQGLAVNVDEKMEADAEKLDDIIKRSMGSADKWPETVEDFARVIDKYMKDDKQKPKDNKKGSQYNNNQGSVAKSLVDKHKAKDFVPCISKKPGKLGEDDTSKQIKTYAQNTNLKQFKRVIAGTGLAKRDHAKKWFYSSLAEKYKIPPPRRKFSGNSYKSHNKWNVGDKVDHLDVSYSVSRGGMLIPGVTTEKRVGKNGRDNIKTEYRDLLIVIDSSISMPDPSNYFSIPVLSCEALAHSALDYGNKVAVVDFAEDVVVCDYTIDRNKIDDTITRYLNQGTIIPGRKILEVVQSNPNPQHIVIVSDTQIGNLENDIGYLKRAVKKAGGGTIFLYGNKSKGTDMLEAAGYDVKSCTTEDDLFKMTHDLNWKLYGDKNAA